LILHLCDEVVVDQKALGLRHPLRQGATAQQAVLRLEEFLPQIILGRRLVPADDFLGLAVDLQGRLRGIERPGQEGDADAQSHCDKQRDQDSPLSADQASAVSRQVQRCGWTGRGKLRLEIKFRNSPRRDQGWKVAARFTASDPGRVVFGSGAHFRPA